MDGVYTNEKTREAVHAPSGRHAASSRLREAELESLIRDRLRDLRRRASLSLARLSKLSGVSRGMLSQIELGRSIPSVTVLARIAAAFDLTLAAFVARDSAPGAEVVRAAGAEELRSADGTFVSRALFPFRGARRSEFYEVRLQPGCRHTSAGHALGTTENLVVVSGEVTVTSHGVSHLLRRGDAIHFGADAPHLYENCGATEALGYLVMTYSEPVTY